MSLFGCIIPGCPVITQFDQVSSTKWSVVLGNAPESVVVFLTGVAPVPDGFALGVFVATLESGLYEYVGHLTNERPSSIFRIPAGFFTIQGPTPIMLGLSLEPHGTIANLGATQSQPLEQTRAVTFLNIAHKIAADLYTFVSSYAKVLSADPTDPQSEELVYLPMKWIDTWKERLDRKMQKDAAFWS